MLTQNQDNTGLAIYLSQTDLQSAGAVYQTSIAYLEKRKVKHNDLLAKAVADGEKLSKEVDDELMQYQVTNKKAIKSIEEQRKPYTEKAHSFIKAFTSIENELGKDLYDPIQKIRDKSAKIHAEEAAEAKRLEQVELAKKQKRIDDIANLESQLRNGYASYLTQVKQTMLFVYTNCNLENITDAHEALKGFSNSELTEEAWSTISLVGDIELINEVRTNEKFDACSNHFASELSKYSEYLIELLPQRKLELEAGIKQSKEAEQLAKKQLEEAEATKLAAQQRADAESAKAKQAATVTVMVAQANREVEAPKTIESYSVIINSVDGWRAIVDYYLTNSGLSSEDIGKVKLDQMRTFAEKEAKTTGEMVSHADIIYEPKYKAVARATGKRKAA